MAILGGTALLATGLLTPPAVSAPGQPVVRPYEVYDPRFCHLTPEPFLCRDCLKRGLQLAQVLTFEPDGRPVRRYLCVPRANP